MNDAMQFSVTLLGFISQFLMMEPIRYITGMIIGILAIELIRRIIQR